MVNEKGLKNRMKSLIKVFNTLEPEKYPFQARMLGFGFLVVMNQQEMAGRIKELADLTNVGIEMFTDGKKVQIKKRGEE